MNTENLKNLPLDETAERHLLHTKNEVLVKELASALEENSVLKEVNQELLGALREVFSLDASLLKDIYGSEFVDRASAIMAKTKSD